MNKIFIQTNRIVVESCVSLGDSAKPKSWSKYSADSSAFQKLNIKPEEEAAAKKSKDKKTKKAAPEEEQKSQKPDKLKEFLEEHKNDKDFIEFMDVHAKGKGIWENDWDLEKQNSSSKKKSDEESEDDEEIVAVEKEKSSEQETGDDGVKVADKDISDADYMKSLVKSDDTSASTKKAPKSDTQKSKLVDLLTIKIRNIPFKTKRQDVLNFFKPLKPHSVRLPTKVKGICYVGFKKEEDFKKAMLKNRSFWSKF